MLGLTTKKRLDLETAKLLRAKEQNVEFYKTGLQDGLSGKRDYELILFAINDKVKGILDQFQEDLSKLKIEESKTFTGAAAYLNTTIKEARDTYNAIVGDMHARTAELLDNELSNVKEFMDDERDAMREFFDSMIKESDNLERIKIDLDRTIQQIEDVSTKMLSDNNKKNLDNQQKIYSALLDMHGDFKTQVMSTRDRVIDVLLGLEKHIKSLDLEGPFTTRMKKLEGLLISKLEELEGFFVPKVKDLEELYISKMEELAEELKRHFTIKLEDAVSEGMAISHDEARALIESLDLEKLIRKKFDASAGEFRNRMNELVDEIKERHAKAADEGVYQGSEAALKAAVDQVLRILDVRTLHRLAQEKENEKT